MSRSAKERLAALSSDLRLTWLNQQPPDILAGIRAGEWWWEGRPEQFAPVGDWLVWLILSGRGWGKTRTGAEWIVNQALRHKADSSGNPTEWLVIGETLADTRTFCIDGPSGIRAVLRRHGLEEVRGNDLRPGQFNYVKAPKPVIYLADGQRIYFEGCGDEDTGRGYNASGAWLDELAKWRYTHSVWMEGILPSIRADLVGDRPRVVVTTTPKPISLLRDWVRRANRQDPMYRLTVGSTFDNAANLSVAVLAEMRREYAGTTIGRQELHGELLAEVEGALWHHALIEHFRVKQAPQLAYTVIGLDPAGTGLGDEQGLVAVGRGEDDDDYVLGDWSKQIAGRAGARLAWQMFAEYDADLLVFEDTFGKQWLVDVLTDAYRELQKDNLFPPGGSVPMKPVHAIHGKRLRAEPWAMRYEQGRVHHVGGFPDMEDQMCSWVPDEQRDSPDRIDALVHAGMWLKSKEKRRGSVIEPVGMINEAPAELAALGMAAGLFVSRATGDPYAA